MSTALAACLAGTTTRAATVTGVRILSLEKDSARVAVTLDGPAAASVSYGLEPGNWTGSADSANPDVRHEIRLPKLIPGRQYFYQVSVDGTPAGDMLTFHSGTSWVTRSASILVTGAPTGRGPVDADAAAQLFAKESNLLVVLGGDGGHAGTLDTLHARSMTDRLVLPVGGAEDPDSPRLVQFSDVALALLGEGELAPSGGATAAALEWANGALTSASGPCWRVMASGRSVAPDSPEAASLAKAAAAAGVDLVLTRGSDTALGRLGPAQWIRLAGTGYADLSMTEGHLTGGVHPEAGPSADLAPVTRDCPIPKLAASSPSAAHSDDLDAGDAGQSNVGGDLAEDCDSH